MAKKFFFPPRVFFKTRHVFPPLKPPPIQFFFPGVLSSLDGSPTFCSTRLVWFAFGQKFVRTSILPPPRRFHFPLFFGISMHAPGGITKKRFLLPPPPSPYPPAYSPLPRRPRSWVPSRAFARSSRLVLSRAAVHSFLSFPPRPQISSPPFFSALSLYGGTV